MQILFLEWDSFGQQDMEEAFQALGHKVTGYDFDGHTDRHNPKLEEDLFQTISSSSFDLVFSFNYFVPVSRVCDKANIKYVSWIFDSPYVQLYSATVVNKCNYIFLFDKQEYLKFKNNRIDTVYYLPLAANAKRLSQMTDFAGFRKAGLENKADIAFVGSLYNESSQFFSRLNHISDYTRGYLEGIMEAQAQIYGYSFLEEVLPKEILDDMDKDLPMQPFPDGVETREYLFSQYVLCREITSRERLKLLTMIGQSYPFDLYTKNRDFKLHNCINHGSVDPYCQAPYVFKNAKINLNITLRSIQSGIPLRAFEVMGAGGFLMTNFQADFDDCYTAGEDYIYYTDPEDLMGKIDYFLTHEQGRKEIAQNGFKKTLSCHSFLLRAQEILEII